MKNIFAYIGFATLIIILAIFCISGITSKKANVPSVQQYVSQVPLPYNLTFCGEAVPMHDQFVKERLDRELTSITFRHSSTIRILKLAYRYFPVIEPILAANGVPDDLKYLAVAESGLENLVSPKNAKGVWQFLAATARSYGLEVTSEVEERYHLEKSTVAACKYFKQAYKKFGNWPMAVASYNRGMAGMAEHISHQKEDDYFDLYLNTETARYVYRILAFKQLMKNPEQYGYYFSSIDLYPPLSENTVVVKSIDNIVTFAKSHNTTYQKIKMLNPWLRKNYLRAKSGKSYTIKLP